MFQSDFPQDSIGFNRNVQTVQACLPPTAIGAPIKPEGKNSGVRIQALARVYILYSTFRVLSQGKFPAFKLEPLIRFLTHLKLPTRQAANHLSLIDF